MKYTIKDISEKTGISIYTLRYYAKEGLFQGVERDKRGTHLFSDSDLEIIYIIECMKNCGMSIKEMRQFTEWTLAGDSTIEQRLALFQKKYEAIKEKMLKMQEVSDALRYKVWFYQTAKEAGTVNIHDQIPPENVPADMREIRARMKHVKRLTGEPAYENPGGEG